MPLGYNPEDLMDNTPKPGKYDARVVDAREVRFNSGNRGLKVRMEVYTSDGITATCFEDCSYSPNGLKFLKRFLEAVGESFDNPPDEKDLIGKTLTAEFALNGNFLSIEKYYPPKQKSGGAQRPSTPAAQANPGRRVVSSHEMQQEDVPF